MRIVVRPLRNPRGGGGGSLLFEELAVHHLAAWGTRPHHCCRVRERNGLHIWPGRVAEHTARLHPRQPSRFGLPLGSSAQLSGLEVTGCSSGRALASWWRRAISPSRAFGSPTARPWGQDRWAADSHYWTAPSPRRPIARSRATLPPSTAPALTCTAACWKSLVGV